MVARTVQPVRKVQTVNEMGCWIALKERDEVGSKGSLILICTQEYDQSMNNKIRLNQNHNFLLKMIIIYLRPMN